MQSVVSAIPTQAAARTFANDGSFESVRGMLLKQAGLYYSRVMGMGLPMEFADVEQEMYLAYVKAKASWNPEKARFTTYCYTVARNEFNHRIEKMVNERQRLGMSSVDDLAVNQDDEVGDGYELYDAVDEDETTNPMTRMERREELRERLAQLSRPAAQLVLALLNQERQGANAPSLTLPELAAHLGLTAKQLTEVQREIQRVFGIRVQLSLGARRARSQAA